MHRTIARTAALLMTLPLLACGGSEERPSDDATPVQPTAQPTANRRDGRTLDDLPRPTPDGPHVTDFLAACKLAKNMPDELCECMAEDAREKLSPEAYDFLVANLSGNKKRADRLKAKLDPTEMTKAGSFMVAAASECTKLSKQ